MVAKPLSAYGQQLENGNKITRQKSVMATTTKTHKKDSWTKQTQRINVRKFENTNKKTYTFFNLFIYIFLIIIYLEINFLKIFEKQEMFISAALIRAAHLECESFF